MKSGIHPEYREITAKCSCGASYQLHSTLKELHLEVCASCHPFYTGRQHFVDSAGMVEKFKRRYGTGKKTEAAASA